MLKPKIQAPGMRIWKTVIAVLLCLIIGYYRKNENANTFYACIAAVITLKANLKDSWKASLERLYATIAGAFFGYLALKTKLAIQLSQQSIFYDLLVVSFVLINLWFVANFVHKGSAALSCVVLLSITLNHVTDGSPSAFAFHRLFDTAIGLFIALLINHLLPNTTAENENLILQNTAKSKLLKFFKKEK